MQVGMTKDRGLCNKPSAALHPGALAARTLLQYNTSPMKMEQTVCSETSAHTIQTPRIRPKEIIQQGEIYAKYKSFQNTSTVENEVKSYISATNLCKVC